MTNRFSKYWTEYFYPSFLFSFIKICFIFFLTTFSFKFLFLNQDVFDTLSISEKVFSLIWGIRFDLAIAAIFSFLTLIVLRLCLIKRKTLNFKYALPFLGILISLQLGDFLYFIDSSRHVSYEIHDFLITPISLFSQGYNTLVNSEHLAFLFIFVLSIGILLFKIPVLIKPSNKKRPLLLSSTDGFLTFLLVVIFIRGGITGLPMDPSFAYNIGDNKKALIALNGAYSSFYSLIRTKHKLEKTILTYETSNDLNHLYSNENLKQNLDLSTIKKQYNLVFVLLESWSIQNQTSFNGEPVTPKFDAWQKKSFSSNLMIAGGHRTTEGIYSIFCSAQNPLGKSIVKTQLQNFEYGCLPSLLRSQGWDTAFFQGSYKNTSGVGSFAQLIGFENSYGKSDIPRETAKYEKNSWGYYDQDIYRFVEQEITTNLQEPFLVGINTNTTHDLTLPKGVTEKFTDTRDNTDRLNTLNFADEALDEFMNNIEKLPLEKPVLYVLVADHTAGLNSSRMSEYSIPWLIYTADHEKMGQKLNGVVSHKDIAPSVAGMLGIYIPWFAGRDLFNTRSDQLFADYYHNGYLGWFKGEYLIDINLNNPDQVDCYLWKEDFYMTSPQTCPKNVTELRDEALSYTKIQQDLLFSGDTTKFNAYK